MKTMEDRILDKIQNSDNVLDSLTGNSEYEAFERTQAAEQLRRVMQLYAMNLTDEQALEVPSVYDTWIVGKAYAFNDMVTYGINGVGDPQLYKVIQEHISQADWTPNATPSLFKPIGLDDSGYPVWAQPTGAHDAYNAGDIVNYNGILYKSIIDGNVWAPDAYPTGWEVVNDG